MQDLKVTLVQADLVWQNAQANLAKFDALLSSLAGKTDLIVLPEMFNSGFSMQPELTSEPENGPTTEWLKAQAAKLGAAICGSIACNTGEGYSNRLLFVCPDGTAHHYDKRHLFRMGKEHEHYLPGQVRTVIEYKGWRILPQICYDLRFPVWSRNHNDYDVVLYVANWPAPRRNPWRTLLQARAIENQCYAIGVNRVGEDGNGLAYSGDSLLVDYLGDIQVDYAPSQAFIETAQLDATKLQAFREKFPAWMDADQFTVQVTERD
ncbi:MAG: amidohydrolase [Pontibacterium sp.]